MAESTPKQPEAKTASQPVKAAPRPQAVIARSQRVRELPAPPKIPSEVADREPPLPPPPPVDLDAIDIHAPQRIARRRRFRLPGPIERWMSDPERRGSIGYLAAGVLHVILFALLAFSFRSNAGSIEPPPIHAQVIVDRAKYLASAANVDVASVTIVESARPVISDSSAKSLAVLQPDLQQHVAKPQADVSPTPEVQSHASKEVPQEQQPPTFTPAQSRALVEGIRERSNFQLDDFHRRTPSGRTEGIHYGGGTLESEAAVERGIGWILAHQRANGSWSFDHATDLCMHYCTNPGSETSTTAATGMALLPFLGAGYTHKTGPYQDAIGRALTYIRERGFKISYGTDFRENSMYGHALATIALCEAYGMTHDEELHNAAQGGLDFIAYCQDTHSGGWRYNPNESGDTTVTAWMIMALKSGQMAGLNVQSPCWQLAEKFLDSVQSTDGSRYGYIDRRPKPATTAAALLCRMYMGWQRDRPALATGVAQLKAKGISKENLYFDYYATQVVFHYGGPDWEGWNKQLRDHLVKTQEHDGHASGSWFFKSEQSAAGGRLYNTAMAVMNLEVYYRHMPLYQELPGK